VGGGTVEAKAFERGESALFVAVNEERVGNGLGGRIAKVAQRLRGSVPDARVVPKQRNERLDGVFCGRRRSDRSRRLRANGSFTIAKACEGKFSRSRRPAPGDGAVRGHTHGRVRSACQPFQDPTGAIVVVEEHRRGECAHGKIGVVEHSLGGSHARAREHGERSQANCRVGICEPSRGGRGGSLTVEPLEGCQRRDPNFFIVVLQSALQCARGFRQVEITECLCREEPRGDLMVGEELLQHLEPDRVGVEDGGPRTSRRSEDRRSTLAQRRE